MASITTEARNELTGLFVALFNAAPGAGYLSDIVAAREAGASLESIAANLATKPEFQTVYPAFLTAQEFAARAVDNLLAPTTPAGAQTWAENWIVGKLNAGETPANVLLQAAQALALTSNANYAASKAQLLNKIEVSNHYSVANEQPSTNLVDLQEVLDGVNDTAASVVAAKAAIDGNLAGETFTLTKGADNFVGTTGADTFIAQSIESVFTAFDELDGGKGVDTLTIYTDGAFNAGFPANAVVKNIEIININNEGAANYGPVDASVFQGATNINQNAFADAVTKLGANTVAGFNDIVAGALSVTAAATAASAAVALNVDDATTLTVAGDALNTVTVTGTVTDAAVPADGVDAIDLNVTVGKNVQALTVNSAVDVVLTATANGKDVTSVDAAASAGAIFFNAATTVAAIKTGAGADEVALNTVFTTTSKAASVTTGAGDDVIEVSLTAAGIAGVTASVDAGEGDDEIFLDNIIDVTVNVNAGAGDDKVYLQAIDTVTEADVIEGGEGFDTIVADGKTLVAEDYILLEEVITGFEGIEFVNVGASIDAARLAGYTAITFAGGASTATNVAAAQKISTSVDVNLTAAGYSTGATTTYAGTVNVTNIESWNDIQVQAETVNLTVVATSNNDGAVDYSEAYLSGDVKVANVVLQSDLDTNGTADTTDDVYEEAYFELYAGNTVGDLHKLTTLTITGKGEVYIENDTGSSLTTIDLSGFETLEGEWSDIYTVSAKAEVIKLGAGQEYVEIENSTYKNMDTIYNLNLVDDAAAAGKQIDWTKSDDLDIADAAGGFVKTTITAGSLNLAFVAAAALADDAVVFQFSGNTYIYEDSNGDNLLNDDDIVVKLVGLIDLDLLVDVL